MEKRGHDAARVVGGKLATVAAADPQPRNAVPSYAIDAFYIAVGAAVVGYQRLAVIRREVEQRHGPLPIPSVVPALFRLVGGLVGEVARSGKRSE